MRKTILITGASRGIGRAVAIQFAKAGYDVVATCHNNIAAMESLKKDLSGLDIDFSYYQCDHSVFENASSLIKSIKIDKPDFKLDVLINNAGISILGLAQELSSDEWNSIWNSNVTSVVSMCKECIPLMLNFHCGKIINISSVWGNVGASMETAYSATKGAINSYTKALAKELAPSGIQVNAIAPGIVDTDMNAHLSEDDLDAIREEIPVGKIGTPWEVAELALQLANAPDYLTGQIITIDGAWT